MEKKYKVLMDTNIIEDNTKEGLRVEVTTIETIDTYTAESGEIIRGVNLKKETTVPKTLKEVNDRIAYLTSVISISEVEKLSLLDEQSSMNTAIDTAIVDKIANGGVDNRKVE